MEGGWQEREQEASTGQALQGRDGDRDRGSQPKRSSGSEREEREESREQSFTAKDQTEDHARGVWGQGGEGRPVDGAGGSGQGGSKVLSSDKTSSDKLETFRIVYTNARSIVGKIDLLRTYVCDLKPSMVCICEASTKSSISDAYLNLDGYNLVVRADGTDTKEGWCRGLLIYVKVGVMAARLESSLIDGMVECEGVTLPWGNGGAVLSVVLAYRPPRYPGSEADNGYTDRLCELLSSLKSPAILLGDLNYSGIDWERLHAESNAEKKVLDTVQNFFWTQHIDFPTRRNPATGEETLLDPALSSSPELVIGASSEGWFSDHVMYSIDLLNPNVKDNSKELVPNWSKADLEQLSANLAELDWEAELSGKSGVEAWDVIKAKIDEETEKCVPKKLRRVNSRPLWMTRNVMRLVRKKRRAWRWYTSSAYSRRDYEEYQAYKKVQDEVRKAVKNAKKNFEKKLAKEARKNNTKPFYSYMKRKTSNRVGVGPLKDSAGGLVTDDDKMAELLNDFFCSVFTTEDCSNIPVAEKLFTGNSPLETVVITEEKVKKKLDKLKPNSAPGPDKLWPRVLQKLSSVIAFPLSIVYTRCLAEGTVPPDWKLANVTPIFKKGSKGSPGNYRPVSLTCVLCKVMESILRDAIVQHLEQYSLLRKSQHGFMAGKSTLSNLLEYLEDLTRLVDEGHAVDIVYLDFAKAFDKVPHMRLMRKCEGLGIQGDILRWVQEWLTDRKQRVVLNGKCSKWGDVLSGVPQGSVLGPTLFLIFINDIDIASDVTGAFIKKFADDTKCYQVVKTQEDREKFQAMLDNLAKWSSDWQMLFNVDKCHVLHIGKKNPEFEYNWGAGQLEVTEEEKDVGVMIAKSLKPSLQSARAAMKANQVLGQMSRGITYRDKYTFTRLYKVYVRPHLQYCSSAWSPYTVADKELLENVQRRAVRMISNLQGSYEQKLRVLGLTTLEENRVRGDMVEMYKMMTGKGKVDFRDWFQLAPSREGAGNTRGSTGYLNVMVSPQSNSEVRRNFFSHRCPRLWNSLPDSVKMVNTVDGFKAAYDDHVKN